ncbi:cell surface protein, partial [Campylobacter fetus]|nr:cell surface protein [Campylobacter fetus]
AVTIDITKVTNVDSTEINFTNGATDMSDKALTIKGSESNDQVTLKLLAATTKVKVDGDLGNQSGDEFTLDVTNAVASVTHIDLSELSTTKGIIDISALTSVLADVKGTKGNDIITLGDKASTAKGEGISIDGGDGNDTFVFKDAAKVTAVDDDANVQSSVIKNFAVGDKIKFDSFVAENKLVVVTSNVDEASATELKTKFADAKITAVDGLNTVADGDIFAYVNGTDTYVVYNKVGGTADELDANDIVVKLAGVKVGTDFNLQLIDGELHAVAIA